MVVLVCVGWVVVCSSGCLAGWVVDWLRACLFDWLGGWLLVVCGGSDAGGLPLTTSLAQQSAECIAAWVPQPPYHHKERRVS